MTSFEWATEYLDTQPRDEFKPSRPRVRTADWLDPVKEAGRSILNTAPLWRIESKPRSVRLTRPLLVTVRAEEGLVFVHNETLAICGTGPSLEEAMTDFSIHAIHFFEYYKALPDEKLLPEAARLKATFEELFVEE